MGTSSLLIIIIFSLITLVVSIVYMSISFSHKKKYRFAWLFLVIVSVSSLIICINFLINTTINKFQSFTQTIETQIEESMRGMADSLSKQQYNDSAIYKNKHVQQLIQWQNDTTQKVPQQFYSYLGFDSYYRFPLTYPYSLHCSPFKDDAELFDEGNVSRFDQNDNGETNMNLAHISKLALDKHYLLIEQILVVNNKAQKNYGLFNFATQQASFLNTKQALFKTAVNAGYKGMHRLLSVEEYAQLFK